MFRTYKMFYRGSRFMVGLAAALVFAATLTAPYAEASAAEAATNAPVITSAAVAAPTATAPAATSAPVATDAAAAVRNAPVYPEAGGVVSLTITSITGRITYDNDDYKVSQKRVDIYQRRLSAAMHDKYLAENKDPPQPVFSALRVAYEKQRYTDWRNSELEFERYQNDLSDKYDSIKSSLKKQYTDILDLEKGMRTYRDEMVKLNANIEQLTAQINVGVAKLSDMDSYSAQKAKLEADMAAKQRDIDLAKYNLKADLKIDQAKSIELAEFDEKFLKYDDSRIDRKIKDSVGKCFAVTSNEKKLQILKDERAIMLQWDHEGAMLTNLQNNEVSIKETEYSLINARNTEESSLWSGYYSLLNQEDQIEVERLNLKTAENDYNVVVARLNQGLVKPIDEQNSRIALENAKTALQSAINNYMRMSEDFQQSLA